MAALDLPARLHGGRPGLRDRRPLRRSGRRRPRPPSASTCRPGCWPPPTPPLRWCGPTSSRSPSRRRRWTGPPAASPCATWSTCRAFLAELARIVRPGGRIGLLEVAEPSHPALRLGHRFYFTRVVPRIGAALSDGHRLPVPAPVGRLPAPRRRPRRRRGRGRLPRRPPAGVVGRNRPAPRRDPVVTPVSPVTGHPVPGGPVTGPPVTGPVTGGPVTGGPVAPTTLVTRTVALETSVDLAAVAGDHGVPVGTRPDGVSLAGRGAAARVCRAVWATAGAPAGDEVAAVLAAIEWDGPHPPVAMGALPFARVRSDAEMVVPAVARAPPGRRLPLVDGHIAGPRAGRRRRSVAAWRRPRRRADGPGPREYRVRSEIDRGAWCRLVGDAAAAVAAGRLDKVVLARARDGGGRPGPSGPPTWPGGSWLSHPSCMVFSIDGFVGASPELLVERHGEQVRSQPLAGTTARTGPGDGGRRAGSAVAVVGQGARGAPSGGRRRLCRPRPLLRRAAACPRSPACVPLGTLAHLGTLIIGRLRPPLPTALDLVGAIHPSPAVGGTPTDAALDYIARRWRGSTGAATPDRSVGWTATATAAWAVGIRSAADRGPTGPPDGRGRHRGRVRSRRRSWPRPISSSSPCWPPSSGPDRRRHDGAPTSRAADTAAWSSSWTATFGRPVGAGHDHGDPARRQARRPRPAPARRRNRSRRRAARARRPGPPGPRRGG